MKSDTKPTNAQPGRSASLRRAAGYSSSSSLVSTKGASTIRTTLLKSPSEGQPKSNQGLQVRQLSKSLEKPFRRMKASRSAKEAYVTAEVMTAIAHQIRALRIQRGWSQKDLAQKMGTTQTAISRLEDPSYGRLTLKTLLDLSQAFDTGLEVKFISLVTMLQNTYFVQADSRLVPSFEEESPMIEFVEAPQHQT